MRLDLVLTPRRLIVPATDEDVEALRHFRAGDLLPVSTHKPRNGDHHRKFMALCAFVVANHPGVPDRTTGEIVPWPGVEAFKNWLKVKTHHYHQIEVYRDTVFMELRSISYRELDEVEFSAWAKQAKQIIFDELFPGLHNRERIEREVDEWMAWT